MFLLYFSVNGRHNGTTDSSSLSPLVNGENKSSRSSRESSPNSNINVNSCEILDISKEELRSVQLRNQNMRQMIYKEVKRPGRDHNKLFEMLRDLHGPKQIRKVYIEEVIFEAKRFKRKRLVELLTENLDQLIVTK